MFCQNLLPRQGQIAKETGKTTPITEAVDKAVDECIADGIMAEFLLKHKSEVRMMCITEYNEELHLQTVRNEGWNEGWNEGRYESKIEGLEALVSTMKKFLPNFDALYQAVIANKIYMDIPKDQVWKIYNSDK